MSIWDILKRIQTNTKIKKQKTKNNKYNNKVKIKSNKKCKKCHTKQNKMNGTQKMFKVQTQTTNLQCV